MNIRASALLSILLAAFTSIAQAQFAYTITDLGTLGGNDSSAASVNYSGQVVGRSTTSFGVYRAFAYWHGVMTDLGTLGGDYSDATAINDHGQIVGTAATPSGTQHAYLFTNGAMTDLGTLSGNRSNATAINNNGVVVGSSTIAYDGTSRAFACNNGTMYDLGTLGGDYSEATAINDANVIAGDATFGPFVDERHAFVFANGSMLPLSNFGGSPIPTPLIVTTAINNSGQIAGYSNNGPVGFTPPDGFFLSKGTTIDLGGVIPDGLNNAGQIVGEVVHFSSLLAVTASGTGSVGNHAFLYSGGVQTDLNTLVDLPGSDFSTLKVASAISDSGYIVGTGLTKSGDSHAFLLTPIPPPSP